MSEISLTIDGVEVKVEAGTTIIKAAEKLGKYIPHFCYHPGLSVVGQCRMCFVEIEGAPKLATACSTPAGDGMKVLTDSEKVKAGQNGTLEFTLLNHPLDCPICDRGGECKLQDYTYEYGPPLSRMEEDKVLRDKHRPISEEIVLDQERCILCTRCVRFSDEVDGKAELVVQNRGNANVVDVFEDRPFDSAFSGNVVDLCPVGALTAKDFRFAARPWELKKHNAICTGCSMGCNVTIDTKHRHPGITRPDGKTPNPKINRLMPRENLDVNTWWMCDYGRWGYHFHNEDEKRIQSPQLRRKQGASLESVNLREIQAFLEQESSKTWEFWVDDNVPAEEIRWAKEVMNSWNSRGRNVSGLNPGSFSDKFLSFWSKRASSAVASGQVDWSTIEKVQNPYSLDELEKRIPILKLKIDQAIRRGQIEWVEYSDLSKVTPEEKALLLLPIPKSNKDLEAFERIPTETPQLILWERTNSRGLLNEGIAPIDAIDHELSAAGPQGPVFFFSQTAQRNVSEEFIKYLAKAPLVVVADSFVGKHTDIARVLLPLTPLYEAPVTFTNVENIQQLSQGIKLQHPNRNFMEKGGEVVSPALKLL